MNWDVLKLIIVLVAFLYLNIKIRPYINPTNYWIMNIGLCLLLFASVLDFTDGIQALDYVPILGENAAFHDTLEDQLGDIPGLALFVLGAFRQIMRSINK